MSEARSEIMDQLLRLITDPDVDPHQLVVLYAAAWGTLVDLCPNEYKTDAYDRMISYCNTKKQELEKCAESTKLS